MRPSLQAMLELQKRDQELEQLTAERDSLPERLRKQQALIDDLQTDLDAHQKHIHDLRLDIDQRDRHFKGAEAKIAQLKSQLRQMKTNKEYSALMREIQGYEMDNTRLEDEILEAMTALDSVEEEQRTIQQKLGTAQDQYQELTREVSQRQAELDESIASITGERQKLAPTIDAQELADYERVRRALGTSAIVPLVDGVCQGCNMPVTPQSANLVLAGRELIRCHHCQRILYMEPASADESKE